MKVSKVREFPRYKVVDLKNLKGLLEGTTGVATQLVTVSRGGCGFYCMDKLPGYSPPRRVFCSFSMDGIASEPVRVQGNLVYAREIQSQGQAVMFYGIEFIKPHRPLIDKIATELERLYDSGLIHKAR